MHEFQGWKSFLIHIYIQMILHIYNVLSMWKGYAVYNFSCINVYRRPEGGMQSELKHVDMNKINKN